MQIQDLIALVGLGLTVASPIFGYLIYLWQKKERRPFYALKYNHILSDIAASFPGLMVHFSGRKDDLDSLSVTTVAVWNAGYETIRRSDVAPTGPILIVPAEGTEILGVRVIEANNSHSQFACTKKRGETSAQVTFEYLDYGNGGVIEVVHTGATEDSVRLSGIVIGAPLNGVPAKLKIVQKKPLPPPIVVRPYFRKSPYIPALIRLSLLIVFLFGGLYLGFRSAVDRPKEQLAVKSIDGVEYMKVDSRYRVAIADDGERKLEYAMPETVMLLIAGLASAFLFRYCQIIYQSMRTRVPISLPQFYDAYYSG